MLTGRKIDTILTTPIGVNGRGPTKHSQTRGHQFLTIHVLLYTKGLHSMAKHEVTNSLLPRVWLCYVGPLYIAVHV
jgi:hypothetical protein